MSNSAHSENAKNHILILGENELKINNTTIKPTTHIADEVKKVDDKVTKNTSDILGFETRRYFK